MWTNVRVYEIQIYYQWPYDLTYPVFLNLSSMSPMLFWILSIFLCRSSCVCCASFISFSVGRGWTPYICQLTHISAKDTKHTGRSCLKSMGLRNCPTRSGSMATLGSSATESTWRTWISVKFQTQDHREPTYLFHYSNHLEAAVKTSCL